MVRSHQCYPFTPQGQKGWVESHPPSLCVSALSILEDRLDDPSRRGPLDGFGLPGSPIDADQFAHGLEVGVTGGLEEVRFEEFPSVPFTLVLDSGVELVEEIYVLRLSGELMKLDFLGGCVRLRL